MLAGDMQAYHFAAHDGKERNEWIEVLHNVTETGNCSKINLLEGGQVRSSEDACAESTAAFLEIHLKIKSEHGQPKSSLKHLKREIDGDMLASVKIAERSVHSVSVSKTGPIVGPIPLRRVARMLVDGSLRFETRLRAATSSTWITKPGITHTIDTIDRLIDHSRGQRNARRIEVEKDLNEFELVQELNWLVAQQSEIAITERFLKSLARSGAKALKEDSRHQIKRTLRALCFCTHAQVVKVADNAERFEVEVHAGDENQRPLRYWYSRRVLQNVGLPLETLKERIMLRKGLPLNATNSATYSNLQAKLDNMELPEIHRYALGAGVEMADLLSGVDINSASREELSAALNDDGDVAAAIFDTAAHTQIDNESDARLHLRGFKQHHAVALRQAGIRYPEVGFFGRPKSFHPTLQLAQDKGRVKDLGELTVEERMYDRRVQFDPLSCFYGYTSEQHSCWWFLVELLRKMVVNLVYLRGVESCDNFPWQECLIVFLIFHGLLHNYEMPYRTRLGNFLEMFSTMFIVMVLHAATSSDGGLDSNESYLSGYVRALFVLVLLAMMGVLFMIIKLRDYWDKRQHKLSTKHANREWGKLRHGIELIQQQHNFPKSSHKDAGPRRLLAAAKRYVHSDSFRVCTQKPLQECLRLLRVGHSST